MTNGGDKIVEQAGTNDRPIEYRPIDSLRPYESNPRKHSKRQMEALCASIRATGFNAPVCIWKNGTILAGHGRVEAAKVVGLKSVPVLDMSDLPFEEARAYVIRDNKISDLASWDPEALSAELDALAADTSLPALEAAGFSAADLAKYLPDADLARRPSNPSTAAASRPSPPRSLGASCVTTAPGETWECGPHRIHIVDSGAAADYPAIMNGAQASLMIAFPPDDDIPALHAPLQAACAVLGGGASHYVLTAPTRAGHAVQAALVRAGLALRHGLIWARPQPDIGDGLDGSPYHPQFTEICYAWRPGAHGFYGPKSEQSVLEFPAGDYADLAPRDMPLPLAERLVRNNSKRGEIVLDPFDVSGSVLMACESRGRRARLICRGSADLTLSRWVEAGGKSPKRITPAKVAA